MKFGGVHFLKKGLKARQNGCCSPGMPSIQPGSNAVCIQFVDEMDSTRRASGYLEKKTSTRKPCSEDSPSSMRARFRCKTLPSQAYGFRLDITKTESGKASRIARARIMLGGDFSTIIDRSGGLSGCTGS